MFVYESAIEYILYIYDMSKQKKLYNVTIIASQDALNAFVVTNNHNQGVGTSTNITCDSTKHVQFT